MSATTASSNGRGPRRWQRWAAIVGVVVVPLAFAGLTVAAVSGVDTEDGSVPVAIVNNDELQYQTADDGTETPFFAGRQLVTELTGADSSFDWVITNDEQADEALSDGEVYAVVTIPDTFSDAVMSLQGGEARAADLSIRTDDAHSFVFGALAQTVGDTLADTFGTAITEQLVAGLYSGLGEVGTSLGSAADGAGELASGSGELSDGLVALSGGVAASQAGAASLSSGVGQYTGGVDSLSSGLAQLNSSAAGLSQLSSGVGSYTNGVAQISAALQAELAKPVPSQATISALSQQLAGLSASGATLSQQTAAGISGVQGGISRSAAGAAQIAGGSAALRSGASSLSSGLAELSAGASSSSDGASALAAGADELASGLSDGAGQVPSLDADAAASAAEVVADPVRVTATRDNEIAGVGTAISALAVPLGLWLGALAVFLVLRPLTRRALASTARSGRLLATTLAKAGALVAAQAVLLVALLHLSLDVSWSTLGATLGFSLLMALVFTAFHHLLTLAFGRAGLVVSLLLLAIQVTSTGGLYPIEFLAAPFQAISPLLPLSHAVSGMQALLAGGNATLVWSSAVALLVFGGLSLLLAAAALARKRRIRSLELLSAVPVGV